MENVRHLEFHQLLTQFASLRVHEPRRVQQLARSIERQGQLMPVVAVPGNEQAVRWILIDGYRRWEALRQLGQDHIWVDVWDRSVDEALLLCLGRGPERAWQAIEEAALIEELSRRHSLRAIAASLGRDVSWVSRRLSLFQALPEDLLTAVRQGKLSLWAASRILAPLARANTDHARTLLALLGDAARNGSAVIIAAHGAGIPPAGGIDRRWQLARGRMQEVTCPSIPC